MLLFYCNYFCMPISIKCFENRLNNLTWSPLKYWKQSFFISTLASRSFVWLVVEPIFICYSHANRTFAVELSVIVYRSLTFSCLFMRLHHSLWLKIHELELQNDINYLAVYILKYMRCNIVIRMKTCKNNGNTINITLRAL